VLAADIYQCGRDKAPNVTEAMQANLISDAMAAAPVIFFPNTFICNFFLFMKAPISLPNVPVDLRFCKMNDKPCVENVT
jgi:hypothetical protein